MFTKDLEQKITELCDVSHILTRFKYDISLTDYVITIALRDNKYDYPSPNTVISANFFYDRDNYIVYTEKSLPINSYMFNAIYYLFEEVHKIVKEEMNVYKQEEMD